MANSVSQSQKFGSNAFDLREWPLMSCQLGFLVRGKTYTDSKAVALYQEVRRVVDNDEDYHVGDSNGRYSGASIAVPVLNCASDRLQ